MSWILTTIDTHRPSTCYQTRLYLSCTMNWEATYRRRCHRRHVTPSPLNCGRMIGQWLSLHSRECSLVYNINYFIEYISLTEKQKLFGMFQSFDILCKIFSINFSEVKWLLWLLFLHYFYYQFSTALYKFSYLLWAIYTTVLQVYLGQPVIPQRRKLLTFAGLGKWLPGLAVYDDVIRPVLFEILWKL